MNDMINPNGDYAQNQRSSGSPPPPPNHAPTGGKGSQSNPASKWIAAVRNVDAGVRGTYITLLGPALIGLLFGQFIGSLAVIALTIVGLVIHKTKFAKTNPAPILRLVAWANLGIWILFLVGGLLTGLFKSMGSGL